MRSLTCLLFCFAPLFAQQSAVAPEAVVLTVEGRQYTRAEFEAILRAQQQDPSDTARRMVTVNQLARVRALAEVARRRNLDKDPEVRARMDIYEAAVLNQALFNALLAEIHADESLARNRWQSQQHIAEERQIRHILIRHTQSKPVAGRLTPEQALAKAQALRKKAATGTAFAALAKTESDDEKTKANGGDLGFVRKPLLNPEFGEAAFRAKEGEISDPVKTSEGYHLLVVEKIAPPAFELVRKSIEFDLTRERLDAMVVEGVKLNPDYFGNK